ncbi:MAG TPA: hypothetical protein DIW31_05405 [Bacteroidales bacterium]|nr:hypothetical protein [Bacteroidales bacterium]
MADENPYISSLENCSDDEIFEIVSNPSEIDDTSKYAEAVSIALKREMISEYQAENLLDGNTTVLDYNPNIIDKQIEDFKEEKAIYLKESRKKMSDILYGLMLIGIGGILLLFAYTGDLFFPTKTKIIGYSSIVIGFLLFIIGLMKKWNKKKNADEAPFNRSFK